MSSIKRTVSFLIIMLVAMFGVALGQEESPQPVEVAEGPAVLMVAQSDMYGNYLVDGQGRTLYTFVDEASPDGDVAEGAEGEHIKAEVVPCTGECLQAWPPFLTAGDVDVQEGADPALVYTYTRPDGSTQVIYSGYTLYYFANDEQPGQINGQGIESFGGTWYLVSPEGEEITQTPSAMDASGSQAMAGAPATPRVAMWRLGALLEQGIETVPTPVVADVFADLRLTLASAGDELAVLAVTISDIEEALLADPFSQPELVDALQAMALELRAAAEEGDLTLMVEVASLLDQTADFIIGEGYVPRMEVGVP